jgi:DNA ligase-associated metallophosphoesterase
MNSGLTIEHASESLTLLPERAVWWEGERTLFIADVHLGKAAAFRAGGLPAPSGGASADLARLSTLIAKTDAARLIVLGDLVHAPEGLTAEPLGPLRSWRVEHAQLDSSLILGNHDRAFDSIAQELSIDLRAEPTSHSPFTLLHDPSKARPGDPALAGHLHPGVRLSGSWKGGSMRARCFWLRHDGVLVLPAFGSFTGLAMIRPEPGDFVYAVGERDVIDVTSGFNRARAAR